MTPWGSLSDAASGLWAWLGTPGAVVAAGLVLALTFLASGQFKVRRPSVLGYQLADLGLPLRLGRVLVPVLGLAEVAVGLGALLAAAAGTAARVVGVLAVSSLTLLTGYLLWLLRWRTGEPCYCFSASTEPAGTRAVVRNVLLALGCVPLLRAGAGRPALALLQGTVLAAGAVGLWTLAGVAVRANRDATALLRPLLPPRDPGRWPEHTVGGAPPADTASMDAASMDAAPMDAAVDPAPVKAR
jgi:hypothetical protein